ncbi:MAG: enzyme of heme biosynthesis [Alistipes sp.]|nr:enzyme of heme biosynthesis [Alistipes sp.]
MKSVKLILAAATVFVAVSASAQDFSDDAKFGKWGATVEERSSNIQASNLFKDAMDSKDYERATAYFQQLLEKCPEATVNTFTRGVVLYKNKVNRARSVDQKKMFVDSLLFIYDKRIEYFGDSSDKGTDYILDLKARDMVKYCATDRPRLREGMKVAIDAALQKNYLKLDLASMYFKNLCEDYEYDDNVTSDMILEEYERMAPYFATATEDELQYKELFENSFGTSAAASCENLEALFSEKLAADPENVDVLAKAVSLMSRAQCSSDFFYDILEKYYVVKPSAETALFLAQGFQNRGDNDKALKYLREALAVETDPAAKEPLYAQISIIEISKSNYAAAAQAARELRAINPQSGYSYFVLAQCYASTPCPDDKVGGVTNYWAAYDAMVHAANLFKSEPTMQRLAQEMAAQYKLNFPTQETCFFAELTDGQEYTVTCGYASGIVTTVRYR